MTRSQTAPGPAPKSLAPANQANSEAPGCSPQQAPWWGVGKALEGRVLGAQKEGEDGSRACTQGVAHHNQAVVFGSAALKTERNLRALPRCLSGLAETREADGSSQSPGIVSVLCGCRGRERGPS